MADVLWLLRRMRAPAKEETRVVLVHYQLGFPEVMPGLTSASVPAKAHGLTTATTGELRKEIEKTFANMPDSSPR